MQAGLRQGGREHLLWQAASSRTLLVQQLSGRISGVSCAEVMDNTLHKMAPVSGQQVFRAHFSSIAAPDILKAMVSACCPKSLPAAGYSQGACS